MQIVDYLIIGQGISGTMLSWFLHKEGRSFMVLDEERETSASRTAAGIINPVTGRRYVYTWMIDEVMPFAVQSYTEMSTHLDSKFVFEKSIIDFFPSPDMRDAFIQSIDRNDTYLHAFPDQNHFNQFFNHDFGCGKIQPAYLVNVQVLMASWKKHLLDKNAIRDEKFILDHLQIKEDGVTYADIKAQKIIFCDGVASLGHPWFQLLPFAPNKGEALIIHSEELTNEHVFKNRYILAPLPVQHTYWVGSNYQWEFKDDQPSAEFLAATTKHLQKWLKVPFKILFHKASVRPATVERRPFVGLHPRFPSVGILNGLGTKGTSLAPFFAHQLVQHLVHNFPITEEADVHRFSRILSK